MYKYARFALVLIFCSYFWYCARNYTDWHFVDAVNLVFHEAGHFIFIFLGQFVQIAGGSVLQLSIPIIITAYFFHNKDHISGSLCLLWVGQNLMNISIYAADAITMKLELLGGENVIHDWNYLLSHTGLLNYTPAISSLLNLAGLITIGVATVLAIYYSVFHVDIKVHEYAQE